MVIVEHDFLPSGVQRCKYCGVSRAMAEAAPQNVCVEREENVLEVGADSQKGLVMQVSGEAAAAFNAVRLDDFSNANKGKLISADEVTGVVVYQDTPELQKTLTLGDHAIRILPVKR
jgi:hypothetical protein